MATETIRQIFNRDFILAFFAQLAFTFVFHILVPTLPVYLSGQEMTKAEIGILVGAFGFSSLLLRPFVGRALVNILEKKFMIAGALLFVIASVAYLFVPPFWPFLIVRIVHGIGFAFFHTASMSLVAHISPEAHRGRSLGYFIVAFNISGAIAPPLGVFLVNHVSFHFLFLICTGLSMCSLLIGSRLGGSERVPVKGSAAGSGLLLSRKAVPPSIVSGFALFAWGGLAAFFPLYAIGQGVANPGFFFTTIAIMLILGRTLGGRMLDIQGKERVILPCLTMYIVSMVLLAFSRTLPMFILVAIIWGIGHAFLIPTLVVYILDRETSSPGPALGTFHTITDLGMTLGPVIMGLIAQKAGYPTMFLCLAFTATLNLSYFYFFLRKTD